MLSYKDWFDRFGDESSNNYETWINQCPDHILLESVLTLDEYLEQKYISMESEYDEMKYDEYKDNKFIESKYDRT